MSDQQNPKEHLYIYPKYQYPEIHLKPLIPESVIYLLGFLYCCSWQVEVNMKCKFTETEAIHVNTKYLHLYQSKVNSKKPIILIHNIPLPQIHEMAPI